MITSIKIKTIAIILCAVIALGGAAGMIAVHAGGKTSGGVVIVLDAGHGGRDGGVVGSSTGAVEAEINLAIVKALEGYLKEKGYKVVLTRKNSDGLYGAFDKNKKMSDMTKRKEIIDKAEPALVVSVHQNFFVSATAKGPQVFYDPSSERGKVAATTMQNVLNAGFGGKRVPMKGDYYILQCSEFPAVLVECGFLSNFEDEKNLVTAEYQKRMAYAIFTGIHALLDTGDVPYYI